MTNKKRILLVSSLLMLPFTFGLFQLTTAFLGPKWGYVTGFLGYWSYCLITAWLVSGLKASEIDIPFSGFDLEFLRGPDHPDLVYFDFHAAQVRFFQVN